MRTASGSLSGARAGYREYGETHRQKSATRPPDLADSLGFRLTHGTTGNGCELIPSNSDGDIWSSPSGFRHALDTVNGLSVSLAAPMMPMDILAADFPLPLLSGRCRYLPHNLNSGRPNFFRAHEELIACGRQYTHRA
jgi:hypothetical protein